MATSSAIGSTSPDIFRPNHHPFAARKPWATDRDATRPDRRAVCSEARGYASTPRTDGHDRFPAVTTALRRFRHHVTVTGHRVTKREHGRTGTKRDVTVTRPLGPVADTTSPRFARTPSPNTAREASAARSPRSQLRQHDQRDPRCDPSGHTARRVTPFGHTSVRQRM